MFEKIKSISISTKITLICTTVFIPLITIINLAVWLSVSYALYHPAQATIEYSMARTKEIFQKSTKSDEEIFNEIRDAIVPGIVLRIFDEHKNLLYDTDTENYPTDETFEKNIITSPSIFAAAGMEIAKIETALVYRASIKITHSGENMTLYFYRTITSQKKIFDRLEKFILTVEILGIILAFVTSRIVSRKILSPVKNMTALANKIITETHSEGVTERIEVPPANDEIAELAETFNKMLDSLQNEISKHKSFSSNASHELDNSLTIILGYVDIMKKFGVDDTELFQESITTIDDETHFMQSLLENLLFISRNDANKLKFKNEIFNLSEIIATNFRRMKISIKNHNFQLNQNDSAQIYGDSTMIAQMIRNIINNAVRYTPSGGSIQINSVVRGDKVFVSISDTGIGIAKENFQKIFEREVRLTEDPFVESARGCGIGLFMVKTVADKQGIEIKVDSTLGQGTTFTLVIPLANDG